MAILELLLKTSFISTLGNRKISQFVSFFIFFDNLGECVCVVDVHCEFVTMEMQDWVSIWTLLIVIDHHYQTGS